VDDRGTSTTPGSISSLVCSDLRLPEALCNTTVDRNICGDRTLHEERSINFRVHALASSLFKGATQYYGANFKVSLPEMRILSSLGRDGELAAYRLVELTAMDKGLVSRVLRALVRRGLITSSAPKLDPRRRVWQLSRNGIELVKRLRPEWRRREAIIQADLSRSERAVLAKLLDRMFVASEKLRGEEALQLKSPRRKAGKSQKPVRAGNGRSRRESTLL
jgi:DNA-binding MarR family transcriptional regulator